MVFFNYRTKHKSPTGDQFRNFSRQCKFFGCIGDQQVAISSPGRGKNKSLTNRILCGWVNPDIFKSNEIANSCPVSYRKTIQMNMTAQGAGPVTLWRMHTLKTFYCRGALGTRVNPDIMGCMLTGEFDGEIFESGEKGCRFKNVQIHVDA